MKNKYTIEIIVSFILIILLILIINPHNLFMPSMNQVMLSGIAFLVFGFFASLILKEKITDEREDKHRGLAGRSAFLVGSTILLIGIVAQTLHSNLDSWLVITLVSMILVKVGTRIYYDRYK